jgi:S-adenosylmethionine hydrolase
VGTDRDAVVLRADGRWFVGPDNGVLAMAARRARTSHWWRIVRRPRLLSNTFHGRDLFAPVAASLTRGDTGELVDIEAPAITGQAWPDDRPAICYIDQYGNLLTGMRGSAVSAQARLEVGESLVEPARTFGEVPPGAPFWYENSNGLVEIAVNQGRADEVLGLGTGDAVGVVAGEGGLS